MIRQASLQDVELIAELVIAGVELPFRVCDASVKMLVERCINSTQGLCLVSADKDGYVVGAIAGFRRRNPLNAHYLVAEQVFCVGSAQEELKEHFDTWVRRNDMTNILVLSEVR